jgi:hypothetical protein
MPIRLVSKSTKSADNKPYIAKLANSALTEKERAARQKTATGMDVYGGGGNTSMAESQQWFSVQLSTDFLEGPQSLREKREIYRHFYKRDPFVGSAIDIHTELPLSKLALAAPKPETCPQMFESADEYGAYILSTFEDMCRRIKLLQKLTTAVHHYWLDGNAVIFAEDSDVEVPKEIGFKRIVERVEADGEVEEHEHWEELEDRKALELAYYRKHYTGWSKLVVLPIDQVKITSWSLSDKYTLELIPSEKDKAICDRASRGDDPDAERIAAEIPAEIREHIEAETLIPLGNDPNEGSFAYLLTSHKGADDEIGSSILDRCLNVLIYREKLRQAQTQIASRAMTPKRVVWGDRISQPDVDDLREQIDMALADPDYTIVANYEIHWEDKYGQDRLLDLSNEYEITNRQLYAGLGITETLLSGEALYSGDRLKLEVMNTRYLFLREYLQEYVQENLFRPVAERMGFVETDKYGRRRVLYPQLSFSRLPLRDSQDTFDALFNLYQKGSLPVETILDLFNIDAAAVKAKLEKDLFTLNDSTFNELLRNIYQAIAQNITTNTNLEDLIVKNLGLKKQAPAGGGDEGRF